MDLTVNRRPLGLALVALLCALSASACMTSKGSPAELLSQALVQYHGHLIFERFDEAAGYVPVPKRDDFMEYYEDQRGELRIAEFEVTRLDISDDQHVAEAQITLSWYELKSMTVHTTRMDQSWRFDTIAEQWEVVEQTVREEKDAAQKVRAAND